MIPDPPANAPAPRPTPHDIRKAIVRKGVANLQGKLKAGQTLKGQDMALLDRLVETDDTAKKEAPKTEDPAPGEPDDILCRTYKQIAEFSGLHQNTLVNWKRRGIAPPGVSPWSLKGWFLLLRKSGLLSETKPTHGPAKKLRSWCFGAGDASDPNDPVHAIPGDWKDDKYRQEVFKAIVERKRSEIELETLRRDRIPMEEYQARWNKKAHLILAVLDGFMGLTREVPGLSDLQRTALNTAIKARIRESRARLVGVKPGKGQHAGPG